MRTPSRRIRSLCLGRLGQLLIFSLMAVFFLQSATPAQQGSDFTTVGTATEEQPSQSDDSQRYLVDTESPRDTLASFLRLGAEFKAALAGHCQKDIG
jgi:hypothetical protein